jgi:hypothetical protein
VAIVLNMLAATVVVGCTGSEASCTLPSSAGGESANPEVRVDFIFGIKI